MRSVGVSADWPHLEGIAAHWDKNTNAAAVFDQWFLNLFPRSKPFVFNGGGYLTLSFIPSLATMIFGLLAGELLRSPRTSDRRKFWILVGAGLVGPGRGEAAGRDRHLPDRQAHLDAELDPVQHRLDLPDPGRVLWRGRHS